MLENNDENHDKFILFISTMLLKYDIDMKKINNEFYDIYEHQYIKLI